MNRPLATIAGQIRERAEMIVARHKVSQNFAELSTLVDAKRMLAYLDELDAAVFVMTAEASKMQRELATANAVIAEVNATIGAAE